MQSNADYTLETHTQLRAHRTPKKRRSNTKHMYYVPKHSMEKPVFHSKFNVTRISGIQHIAEHGWFAEMRFRLVIQVISRIKTLNARTVL